MPVLKNPIKWFGGKGKMRDKIVPILEQIPHKRYAEPFGGGASILIAKKPALIETYNDIDNGLYDFFMVLSDPDDFKQFLRRVRVLPYSRQLYNECRANWQTEPDKIKRVAMWFVLARQGFGGQFGSSWGTVVTTSKRCMAQTTSSWISTIAALPRVHQRLQRVQIENADWRRIIERYDTDETLFYLDSPYTLSQRSAGGYAHELQDQDHADLVKILLSIKGYAALSGYPNDIYKPLEQAGWERIDWQTACFAAGRTRASNLQGKGAAMKHQGRTECLWVSPGALVKQLSLFEVTS